MLNLRPHKIRCIDIPIGKRVQADHARSSARGLKQQTVRANLRGVVVLSGAKCLQIREFFRDRHKLSVWLRSVLQAFHWVVVVVTGDGFANVFGKYPVEHFLLFGLPTNPLSMPTTGSANYSGVVYGSGGNYFGSQLEAVTGTGQLSVNFANSTLTGSLNLAMTPQGGGVAQALGILPFAGTVSGATFTTTISQNVAAPSSYLAGGFYGSQAAEVGATFKLDLPGPSQQPANTVTVNGVFVGKKT